MSGKRLQLARFLMAIRAHLVASSWRGASLIVLNYHRIRAHAGAETKFDDGVFETDVGVFDAQMKWLRARTIMLDEPALLELVRNGSARRGALYSVVTFDDGYVDCHDLVKPILDGLGIRGIFFIPVGILESRKLGWWDQAAYMLK